MSYGNFIAGCWILLFAYWLISAFFTKKAVEREFSAGGLAYRVLMILALFLLIDFDFQYPVYPLTIQVLPSSMLSGIIGCIVCALGLALAIWARVTIAGNWSADVTFKENHELIQRGPYAFVRHPIYTAFLMMYLGSMIVIGHLGGLLGIFVLFVSFLIKLRQEEQLMLKHFHHQYEEYMKRVKALIPYLF